jgi:hypothetical protein
MLSRSLAVFAALFFSLPPVANNPHSPTTPGASFEKLGCACGPVIDIGTTMTCRVLPAFGDNEWTHQRARTFASNAGDFAANLQLAKSGFKGNFYLALQGMADNRQIMRPKSWQTASPGCRANHDMGEPITNLDLAFLRACELRQYLSPAIAKQTELLRPIDYTDVKSRLEPGQKYVGDQYKAVALVLVFPDRKVCGHGKQ